MAELSGFSARSAIAVLMVLMSCTAMRAQGGSAWVSDCTERNGAAICQGWSIQGGDRLEAVFGCTGASGGGVLACRGRTLCELREHVTVRGFHDTCETESTTPPGEAEYEERPSPDEALLDPQKDEALAKDLVEELWEAKSHAERMEILRINYALFELPLENSGPAGSRSTWLTGASLETMEIPTILYWARTDCDRARTRLNEPARLANRGVEFWRRAFAMEVNDLVCGTTGRQATPPARPAAVQPGAACVIHDRNDTSANVRTSPNGEIVNRLRNGRRVTVASVRNDTKGRPWMFVEGEYNGTWRSWGYVFGELLDCAQPLTAKPAKPAPVPAAMVAPPAVSAERRLQIQCSLNNGADESLDACSQIIAKGTSIAVQDRAWAHHRRAGNHYALGNIEAALADLTEAIRLAPDYADAYLERGVIYQRQGNADLAIADYDQVARIDPGHDHGIIYVHRASALVDIKAYDRALQDYSKALQLNPENGGALVGRGAAHLKLRQFDLAVDDFTAAIGRDPDDASSYASRGYAYLKLGDAERALADYDKAIAIDPTTARLYNDRGAAHVDLGNADRAIADLNVALRLKPDYAYPYRHRGRAFVLRKDFVSAMADFDRAILLDPKYGAAYLSRGLAHEMQGNLARALEDLTISAFLDPELADLEAARRRVRERID